MTKISALLITLFTTNLLFGCNSVSTDGFLPTTEIDTSSKPSDVQDLLGIWQIEFIKKRAVIDNSPARLIFQENNKLAGSTSCNNLHSSYQVIANKLTIANAATTRKMCAPALMEQETRLLGGLNQVNQYQIKQEMLLLYNSKAELIFKARRTK